MTFQKGAQNILTENFDCLIERNINIRGSVQETKSGLTFQIYITKRRPFISIHLVVKPIKALTLFCPSLLGLCMLKGV